MDILRKRLLNIKDFDELSELCCLDENIILATDILNDISMNVTPKNFLSSFIMYNCSSDIIGETHLFENKELIDTAKNIIFSETSDDIKQYLNKYTILFNIWKERDFNVIINSLSEEYFQTNLSMLNIEIKNIEKKILLTCYKNKILDYASKIISDNNIIDKIKAYSPIIITSNYIDTFYNKGFWKDFYDDFDSDNFKSFISTIDFLNNFYSLLLSRKKEVIDIIFNKEYFINILNENNYTNDDIKFFANKSYDFIKSIHSKEKDAILEEYRFEVNSNSTYLPDIIEHIMELTKQLLKNIEDMGKN